MDAGRSSEVTPMTPRTTVERTSDRELTVTRTINGPARLVFEAWHHAGALHPVVDAEVDGHDHPVVRDGRAHRRRLSTRSRLRRRRADGVLRPLPRRHAAGALRLDQRRERGRCGPCHDRHVRGARREDARRHAGALSVEGGARRGRHRRGRGDGRDVGISSRRCWSRWPRTTAAPDWVRGRRPARPAPPAARATAAR